MLISLAIVGAGAFILNLAMSTDEPEFIRQGARGDGKAAEAECADRRQGPAVTFAVASPDDLAVRRLRLLRRIESRYRVVTETVSVGAITFPFTRIAEPDRVLTKSPPRKTDSKRSTASARRRLPSPALLGRVVGQRAGLSLVLERHAIDWTPESTDVLDLGCGMGLSGTSAAALGARSILFADLEAPALLFARLNSLPSAPRVRARRTDWRRDNLRQRFDLILGADILYERKQWDHLEPFWRAHLAPGGSILLGEPGRPTGDLFPEWIRPRGWSLTAPRTARPHSANARFDCSCSNGFHKAWVPQVGVLADLCRCAAPGRAQVAEYRDLWHPKVHFP
jgi:predicted nicotinamide N-methyase